MWMWMTVRRTGNSMDGMALHRARSEENLRRKICQTLLQREMTGRDTGCDGSVRDEMGRRDFGVHRDPPFASSTAGDGGQRRSDVLGACFFKFFYFFHSFEITGGFIRRPKGLVRVIQVLQFS